MKKLYFLVVAIFAINAFAGDFSITTQDRSTARFTTNSPVSDDGWQRYDVVTSGGNLGKAQSMDVYNINCKTKRVIVTYGPTSGGVTGITVPGSGQIEWTNKEDVNRVLSMACK